MTRLSERRLRETNDVLRNHRGPIVEYGQPEVPALYNLLKYGPSQSETAVRFALRHEEVNQTARRIGPIRQMLRQTMNFLRGETPEVLSSGD